jgi:DNA-binding sugar fermentation-stimulating protein
MVILKEPHRPNRFIVIAQSGEELIRAHCPNAGRELILEKPFGP